MGCVHRFQMFTPYKNNAIVTRLERQKRPIHITVEEHGPPEPTVRLAPEDIALLRVGIRRQLTACSDARVIVARERTIDMPRSDS